MVVSSLDKDFDDIFGTPRPQAQAADQDDTTPARPEKPGNSSFSVSSLEATNAGLLHEVAPASFTPPLANQLIIEAGRANYEVITAKIENILARDGLALDDLGERYERAWELFERGGWELRAGLDAPFRVDSQETSKRKKDRKGAGNLEYRVYCKELPGHREAGYANSCECYDHTHDQGGGGLAGYCKHVTLTLIVFLAAEIVKAERRRPGRGGDYETLGHS